MAAFLQLPHEILQHVLAEVRAKDLAALTASFRELQKFITGNRLLHQKVYVNHFDDPIAVGAKSGNVDWERDLHSLIRAVSILHGEDTDAKRANFRDVAEQIAVLVREASHDAASSENVRLLKKTFDQNDDNRDIFLCQSNTFHRLRYSLRDKSGISPPPEPASFEDRQLSAKLHCLYGPPILHLRRQHTRAYRTYPFACSKVYDLRNYTRETMWGPFMEDGSGCVDWERVEAIMVVLSYNLNMFENRERIDYGAEWCKPFEGCGPNSYISKDGPRADISGLQAKDPYNITGTWHRIVTFLDFTELFSYNFVTPSPGAGNPRPPLDTTEAIRLISMELRVSKIEPPGPDDGQDLPIVYFVGISKSVHQNWDPNANSGIRGHVRLTKEGEVRWTSWSIYQGEERWRSEGVQIGGPNSRRGVVGNWFDKDYDLHGPAGPTALWKVSDEISAVDSDDEEGFNGNFFGVNNAPHDHDAMDQDDDDDDEDGEDGVDLTHQALLDMITHIHAHHTNGNSTGLINSEGVFTGLNGMGINVQVAVEGEEDDGDGEEHHEDQSHS